MNTINDSIFRKLLDKNERIVQLTNECSRIINEFRWLFDHNKNLANNATFIPIYEALKTAEEGLGSAHVKLASYLEKDLEL